MCRLPTPSAAARRLAGVLATSLLVALPVACGGGDPDAAAGGGVGAEAGESDTRPPPGEEATDEGAGEEATTDPQPPPDTDVYLARLEGERSTLRLREARNVTARPGYDNQPSFLPDGSAILYTAVDEAGQADTWRLDLAAGGGADAPVRVTATAPESEYSPTPLPGGGGFSVVRVEADSTQRLWRFAMDGTAPELVLPGVEPVGYHAWSGPRTLLLYVLGEPSTLQAADLEDGTPRVVATDVGRSLQPVPGTAAVSFVQRRPDGGTTVMRWDPSTGISPVTDALDDGEDHAWTPGGTLLMGSGSRVMAWRPDASPDDPEAASAAWVAVGDLAEMGVATVTRLAVSPDGAWIAVVGEGSGG